MKKTILAAVAAISAAVALVGCNQSSDNAAQAASQPQAVAPTVATGKLAETDSKNSGWWAAENGANDCIDESSPAQVIKLVSYNRDQYTTQDSIDEHGDIMRTDMRVPAENMQITFYRQKSACMASIQVPQDVASADEAKYGGEGATPPQAAQSASAPASEPDWLHSYDDKVRRRVRPHIEWEGPSAGLETMIAIRCAPSGALLSATIQRSSGNAQWDAAAIKAVQSADPMPSDSNGRAPAEFEITLRPAG